MRTVIQFDKEEFDLLLIKFVEHLLEWQEKTYGFSIISNETGKVIKDKETICGSLLIPWNDTFKIK